MAQIQPRQGIPTKLSKAQFEQFILPHLSKGRRGPATTLSFHAIFNYILHLLYLGCQWQHLPIEKDGHGRREIHPTSLYRTFRRWQAEGCFDLIFEGSVLNNWLQVSEDRVWHKIRNSDQSEGWSARSG
jgi:transposase